MMRIRLSDRISSRPPYLAALAAVVMASFACGSNSDGIVVISRSNSFVTANTPFIQTVQLEGDNFDQLVTVRYTIASKTGNASKPVNVKYTAAALERRGYLSGRVLSLPVFGLYPGYTNRVSVELQFEDASVQTIPVDLNTESYTDPNGIYDHPTILTKRTAGGALGFDFFFLKTDYGTPVVIDTDGEVRWVGSGVKNSYGTTFRGNSFFIGNPSSTTLTRLELDGSISESKLTSGNYTIFHHNIDPGKQGMMADMNTSSDVETIAAEITDTGDVIKEWNLATILSEYMLDHGDDPALFVRQGADWFHMNSTAYDPGDDSLIVSSRENFVIKVDYETGNVVWILGDPNKYWHQFQSLRDKALTLESGGLYPIGQHAVSITSDGLLLLFNNGSASFNQPKGKPAGQSRKYSAVSAYEIDPIGRTAREVWRFDHGKTVMSSICSSVYEALSQSLLINYCGADNWTKARLVGLDANHNVIFEFQYPDTFCRTSWNAEPIPFDDLTFE